MATVEKKNTYKVAVMGSGGSGKTTWLRRHITGQFVPTYIPTIGVEVHPITFKTTDGDICVNFWDTAGQEKLGGLRDGYYISADAGIVFYDCSNKLSYLDVMQWARDFLRVAAGKPIVICGNKVDLPEETQKIVNPTIHRDLECSLYPVSALSCYNYEKPILDLLRKLRGKPELTFVEDCTNSSTVTQMMELIAKL